MLKLHRIFYLFIFLASQITVAMHTGSPGGDGDYSEKIAESLANLDKVIISITKALEDINKTRDDSKDIESLSDLDKEIKSTVDKANHLYAIAVNDALTLLKKNFKRDGLGDRSDLGKEIKSIVEEANNFYANAANDALTLLKKNFKCDDLGQESEPEDCVNTDLLSDLKASVANLNYPSISLKNSQSTANNKRNNESCKPRSKRPLTRKNALKNSPTGQQRSGAKRKNALRTS